MILYNNYILGGLFIACALLIWIFGVKLATAVDVVVHHYGWGEAFGGMLFLAIIADLPEIAITASAAYKHEYVIAVSNLLGGIAIQTVVLVLIDIFGVGRKAPLTNKGHSNILKIESITVIVILLVLLLGYYNASTIKVPVKYSFEMLCLIIWLVSIFWTKKLYNTHQIKKQAKTNIQTFQPSPIISTIVKPISIHKNKKVASAIIIIFIGSLVMLFAGIGLEMSGEILSKRWGLSGVVFGGTILALCTALPEISTGIASAKIRDYEMAMSDIFGGNSFLALLLLMAAIISGESLLGYFSPSDIYLIWVGITLTFVYLIGMYFHSKKQYLRMGVDSIIVLVLYLISIAGLVYMNK
ncbi:MAG: sodium:calcium antiporter [Chitinophagaceae bacterium]